MMRGFYGGFHGLGILFCGILGLAILVGLILLVVWAVRRLSGGTSTSNKVLPESGKPNPKQILQARYTSGEITKEQYLQMLEDIGK